MRSCHVTSINDLRDRPLSVVVVYTLKATWFVICSTLTPHIDFYFGVPYYLSHTTVAFALVRPIEVSCRTNKPGFQLLLQAISRASPRTPWLRKEQFNAGP